MVAVGMVLLPLVIWIGGPATIPLRDALIVIVVVPGVDHFFAGKLKELDAAITDWMMERHQGLTKIIG